MLPDMDFGRRESVFVPFFGVPAATLTAPARIVAATGGQVMHLVARRIVDHSMLLGGLAQRSRDFR